MGSLEGANVGKDPQGNMNDVDELKQSATATMNEADFSYRYSEWNDSPAMNPMNSYIIPPGDASLSREVDTSDYINGRDPHLAAILALMPPPVEPSISLFGESYLEANSTLEDLPSGDCPLPFTEPLLLDQPTPAEITANRDPLFGRRYKAGNPPIREDPGVYQNSTTHPLSWKPLVGSTLTLLNFLVPSI